MRSALPLACKNYEFLIMNCPDGVVERLARQHFASLPIRNCLDGVVERDARPPMISKAYGFRSALPLALARTSLTPNKNIADFMRTGCAEGTPLCETHCKPQSGAAVGITA